MKLADQVVSLKLSQKLHEFGVKSDSLFKWAKWIPPRGSTYSDDSIAWKLTRGTSSDDYELIPAYTVAELGNMLPNNLKIESQYYTYHLHYINGKYGCSCYYAYYEPAEKRWIPLNMIGHGTSILSNAEADADARAEMLIWLIEERHVKA